MRDLITKAVIIVAALFVAVWSIYPPEKSLRLGKDLRGGVSLTYQALLASGDQPGEVIPQIIEVLMDRIDPEGKSDISMVPQSGDRIEITMPLPSARVKGLKAAVEAELVKLDATVIQPGELSRVMRLAPEARERELASLARSDPSRLELLQAAASAYDRWSSALGPYNDARAEADEARAALRAAEELGPPEGSVVARVTLAQAALDRAVETVAEADLEWERARDAVLATSLPADRVRPILQLSDRDRRLYDEQTKEWLVLASPRQQAIESLLERYPTQRAAIDRVLAAFAVYESERVALDDPADLKRLVRAAGVLDFRITVDPGSHMEEARLRAELRENGPLAVKSRDTGWYRINRVDTWYDKADQFRALTRDPAGYFQGTGYVVELYDGEYWMLCWDIRGSRLTKAEGDWSVARAFDDVDRFGRPAVGFEMNAAGASKLAALTKPHVGKRMAILLDDQVYTAPNLLDTLSKRGVISGDFPPEERTYIKRVLAAGSLQAKLSPTPISEVELGPDLGLDNLRSGLRAGAISLALVGAFMAVYYFQFGLVAVVALLCNAVLILGLMALNRFAFTMPGIAGVVLTFGMAVDANVLVYERVREEIRRGNDLRTSLRLGYSRALSSIVDGNVTNLIVCVVLYFAGTPEIKGFAITLGIGVVTTLFCALFVSRFIFDVFVEHLRFRRASMLPLAIPAIDRILEPRVNWLRLRFVLWVFSAAYVGLGVGMIAFQGGEMFDNEFRGGTQVTLQFREEAPGRPMTLTRRQVQDRVVEIAQAAAENSELRKLRNADILPVNPRSDGVTSDTFVIKTLAVDRSGGDQNLIKQSIVAAFHDELGTFEALTFTDADLRDVGRAPLYRVLSRTLGADIGRPEVRDDVEAYRGGAAIVLADITPPVAADELRQRLQQHREDSYPQTLGREWELRVLEGEPSAVRDAVILVRDPQLTFFESADAWTRQVAATEWSIARGALTQSGSPASFVTFDPAIAESFRAKAIVAVVLSFLLISIYIWVRFGAVRYALAALIPLVHDVLTAVGFIALAEILHDSAATSAIAQKLGIQPFKIDLATIAALLTIIGYSLNDTIVMMDRVRENRGKLPRASAQHINDAVNQTLSRTVITSGTTMFAILVLFFAGGEGTRGFAYALAIGVFVGTWSTISVAAPIVWVKRLTDATPPAGGVAGKPGTSEVAPAAPSA